MWCAGSAHITLGTARDGHLYRAPCPDCQGSDRIGEVDNGYCLTCDGEGCDDCHETGQQKACGWCGARSGKPCHPMCTLRTGGLTQP